MYLNISAHLVDGGVGEVYAVVAGGVGVAGVLLRGEPRQPVLVQVGHQRTHAAQGKYLDTGLENICPADLVTSTYSRRSNLCPLSVRGREM